MIITPKLRLCLLLTLAMFASGAMIVGEALAVDWFNEDWSYRKMITVVGPVINGPHEDFPMLVSLASDSELAANAQANGGDILFTSSDGTSKLSHEIEYYNSGTLVAWVRIPTPGIDNGTVIYMYYGDTDYATNGDQWETDGSTWDSNYAMVQHLQETVTDEGSSANAHIDSTSNNNHGNQEGNDDIAGKIYNGQDFDGVDDNIDVGDLSANALTVSLWFKPTQTINNSMTFQTFIIFNTATDARIVFGGGFTGDLTNEIIFVSMPSWRFRGWCSATGSISPDWHHLAIRWNATSTIGYEIYIDGERKDNCYYIPVGPVQIPADNVRLGASSYNGSMDEVRISSNARSEDWIKTFFNNQDDPSAFLSVSEQVSIPTMTEWGMIIFMLFAGLVSIYYLRRKRIEG